MTLVDLLTKPTLIQDAWDLLPHGADQGDKVPAVHLPRGQPAIWLNQKIMAEYRERMRRFYYDPSKYDTYLQQLGISYSTVRSGPAAEKK